MKNNEKVNKPSEINELYNPLVNEMIKNNFFTFNHSNSDDL